jgi:NitT/TauT family transport system substrate-binding protein
MTRCFGHPRYHPGESRGPCLNSCYVAKWIPAFAGMVMLVVALLAASAEAAEKVMIGSVPSPTAVGTWIAIDKGYFRDAGIDVDMENAQSAGAVMPMLASNRIQIIEGGMAASYWNALGQGMPVTIAMERGTTPLNHSLLVRSELVDKIKTVADLKGHSFAFVSPDGIQLYEAGKILAPAGLRLKDLDVKYIAYSQQIVAFQNGAVDAAMSIPPFSDTILDQKRGFKLVDVDATVRPVPMANVVYMINTDWAKAQPKLAHDVFVALARGARDYCQAYHGGPNRDYVIELMIEKKIGTRDMLEGRPWAARDPNGRVDAASMLDIQNWFYDEGLVKQKFPIERLIDASFAQEAAKELGPFELINKSSQLAGCR